jgi:hypothetical protein
MVLLQMFTWWYVTAWPDFLRRTQRTARGVLEAFSVSLLSHTLFAPFRQIDAVKVRGSLGQQLQAWFDRSFSRIVGVCVRSIMIIAGYIGAAGVIVLGTVGAVLWLCVPLLPVIGVILMLSGKTL